MSKNTANVLYFMDGIGNAGGIQEMAVKWMENTDWEKVHIDILSYDTGKKDNYSERVGQYGCKVYIIPTYVRKGQFFESIKATKAFFKQHQGEYDVLHAHASAKALFVLWYAKRYGIKTRILHSHCSRVISENKVQRLAAALFKDPANWLTTDEFACSPEAGAYLFGEEEVNKGNVKIVHNGIDTDKFRPDAQLRNVVRNELNVADKFVIGNVGRFRYPKNHDYLIDIFAEVYKKDPNVMLVCVGTGELEDKIKEKCKMLQIDDRVKFLGFRSDVNRIMQAFDLLVMPSHFAGLPVTGVEAQAIGVPVLFATTITKDAAILPQSAYLNLSDSPEVWAEKILEYKNMQRENDPHKWIEEKGYDIKKETKKLDDFYLEKSNMM